MGVSSNSRASGESPLVRGAVPRGSLGDEVAGPKAGFDRFGGGVCNAVEGGKVGVHACTLTSCCPLPTVTLWAQVTSSIMDVF